MTSTAEKIGNAVVQAWCDPKVSNRVMDTELAQVIIENVLSVIGQKPDIVTLEFSIDASEARKMVDNAILTINQCDDAEKAAYFGLRMAQKLASDTANNAGWYKNPETGETIKRNFGEVVALMHSELSEALEADRKGLKDDKLPHRDGREVEFADCIIRILDTAAAEGLDVPGAFIEKNRYNQSRADHKLEARAKGGKRY